MLIVLVIALVSAILGGILADRKNRSVAGWAFLCFLLPICVLFILAIKPLPAAPPAPFAKKPTALTPRQTAASDWECPKCGVPLAGVVDRCPFCDTRRPPQAEPVPNPEAKTTPEAETTLCPYCREEIKVGAIRCKHCLKDFDGPVAAEPPTLDTATEGR